MAERRTYVFDTEIYPNYFLAAFKNIETGKVVSFEMADGEELDCARLGKFIRRHRIIGFNSRTFDLLVLFYAIDGANCEQLKALVNDIIFGSGKPWELEDQYGFKVPRNLDHIDLIEVAPGQASLKIYNGRLHGLRMQDLPFDPDQRLTPKQMDIVYDYCVNDLDATKLLFEKLGPQLALRETMTKEYGTDLRSKSDAQIAEAVIVKQVEELIGERPRPQKVHAGKGFRYAIPEFVRFHSDDLNDLLDDIEDATFKVSYAGQVLMPQVLADRQIVIGDGVYRLGIGGLHSSEKTCSHVADDDHILVDRDVASYYPAIIINLGLHPENMGWAFQKVYKRIVNRRLKAKAAGDKVTADSLKITINGSFGKFGSPYSALYSPNLLIQTTVTGQLCLLMLIERLERRGIRVVSANTDGIVIRCPVRLRDRMLEVVKGWEEDTAFTTEETPYKAIFSRDVNNYIAVKLDGKAKAKGAYADEGLQKNPTNEICIEAVKAKLTDGTPLGETIRACRDIRKFVTIRTVNGGAVAGMRAEEVDDWVSVGDRLWMRQAWLDSGKAVEKMAVKRKSRPHPVEVTTGGEYLGKAIRWIYSTEVKGAIHYAKSTMKGTHNKVPRSDGARPLMELPDTFPDDLDYAWYVAEARSILEDIGYMSALV